jgi:hypothetical protein
MYKEIRPTVERGRKRDSQLGMILVGVFSILALSGCFSAVRYAVPEDKRGSRLFDRYLIDLRVTNDNYSTFNYSVKDIDYRVLVLLREDTLSAPNATKDTARAVRIRDLCIGSACLARVYCPLLVRDTVVSWLLEVDGGHRPFLCRQLGFGYLEIPDDCPNIDISLEAVLTDTETGAIVSVETLQLTLNREEKKIPAAFAH